jgi:hypothetical protein
MFRLVEVVLRIFRSDGKDAKAMEQLGREAIRPYFDGIKAEVEEQVAVLAQGFGGRTMEQLIEGEHSVPVLTVDSVPVAEPEAEAIPVAADPEPDPEAIPEAWDDLKAMCKQYGIKVHGKKKPVLVAALRRKLKKAA